MVNHILSVSEGYDTAEKIKHAFGFVNRQSSYYRHAAEILGLVSGIAYGDTRLLTKEKNTLVLLPTRNPDISVNSF